MLYNGIKGAIVLMMAYIIFSELSLFKFAARQATLREKNLLKKSLRGHIMVIIGLLGLAGLSLYMVFLAERNLINQISLIYGAVQVTCILLMYWGRKVRSEIYTYFKNTEENNREIID